MAIHVFENIRVFLITDSGAFEPVSGAASSGELDTDDFSGGVWGLFRESDGMLNKLDGDMTLWDSGGEPQNEFSITNLCIWYDMNGAPFTFAGTYVTVGIHYYSGHQEIDIGIDASISGDGYVAAVAEYSTLDADREVFWAFSDYFPASVIVTGFWVSLVGTRQYK